MRVPAGRPVGKVESGSRRTARFLCLWFARPLGRGYTVVMKYLFSLLLLVLAVACGDDTTTVVEKTRAVEYSAKVVEGSFSKVTITWGDESGALIEEDVALPFSKKLDIPVSKNAYLGVSGMAEGESVTVALSISVDGQVKAEDTRTAFTPTFDVQAPLQ